MAEAELYRRIETVAIHIESGHRSDSIFNTYQYLSREHVTGPDHRVMMGA